MKKPYIKNDLSTMLVVDIKGKKEALYLKPGEMFGPLSEKEVGCQNLVSLKRDGHISVIYKEQPLKKEDVKKEEEPKKKEESPKKEEESKKEPLSDKSIDDKGLRGKEGLKKPEKDKVSENKK